MRTFYFGKVIIMPKKYTPEVQVKAVRLVRDHVDDYASEWEAIKTVAKRLGIGAETLRRWVRQAEIDEGVSEGTTMTASIEIRALKRKNAELERTVEILKAATTFFARELDPTQK